MGNQNQERHELTPEETEIAVREGLEPSKWLCAGSNLHYLFLVKRDDSEFQHVPLKAVTRRD